jgi:hypothetical protein
MMIKRTKVGILEKLVLIRGLAMDQREQILVAPVPMVAVTMKAEGVLVVEAIANIH